LSAFDNFVEDQKLAKSFDAKQFGITWKSNGLMRRTYSLCTNQMVISELLFMY